VVKTPDVSHISEVRVLTPDQHIFYALSQGKIKNRWITHSLLRRSQPEALVTVSRQIK
jgi:hypothetical protein